MTTEPVSPTSGGEDDGGWHGRQEHADRPQPGQAQRVVHAMLKQQVPGQVQRKAAEQQERVEGAQRLALTGNQRDHRLTLALRDYTIASQACRRKASPDRRPRRRRFAEVLSVTAYSPADWTAPSARS